MKHFHSMPWASAEAKLETRADGTRRLSGYAAVWDQVADLGYAKEVVRRGAFTKTLQEGDPASVWNHDSNYVLGRKSAGTLRLSEDERGLRYEVDPPETTWAKDLLVSIERGDVRGMSFSFEAVHADMSLNDGEPLRELREVKLYEVGPVTFPAYEGTEVQVRSAFRTLAEARDPAVFLSCLRKGGLTDPEIRGLFAASGELLGGGADQSPDSTTWAAAARGRELQLVELEDGA